MQVRRKGAAVLKEQRHKYTHTYTRCRARQMESNRLSGRDITAKRAVAGGIGKRFAAAGALRSAMAPLLRKHCQNSHHTAREPPFLNFCTCGDQEAETFSFVSFRNEMSMQHRQIKPAYELVSRERDRPTQVISRPGAFSWRSPRMHVIAFLFCDAKSRGRYSGVWEKKIAFHRKKLFYRVYIPGRIMVCCRGLLV